MGAETSPLNDDLVWAQALKAALDQGLEATLRTLAAHRREIESLPDTGVPGALRSEVSGELKQLTERLSQPDFHLHGPEYTSLLTHLQARVRDATLLQSAQQARRLKDGVEVLQRTPGWAELTQEERGSTVAQVEQLALETTQDLAGLKRLLARDFDISSTVGQLERSVQAQGQDRLRLRVAEERARYGGTGPSKLERRHRLPARIGSAAELGRVITQLQELQAQAGAYAEVDIAFVIGGDPAGTT
jgi:hypothetical protein